MNFLRKIFGRNKVDCPKQEPWLSGEKLYEGFPLLLRKPAVIDYANLPPALLTIVQHLEKTKPNGLPEPDYNHALADFDQEVINYLPSRRTGRVVLVETFGHKRSYYCYCDAAASPEEIKNHFEERYPSFRLEISKRPDSEAKFIRQYAKEHC
ncbi:MAG: hypothetical protein JWO81_3484 [Alphaproteobacteria bacterium]|nr:hypothetical protein [Alphaproteobacteria bacterium]